MDPERQTVTKDELVDVIRSSSNPEQFRALHWSGTFGQYLDIVLERPEVLRTAHQRLYDMILSHGHEEVTVQKERFTRYRFFSDVLGGGQDAIFGLEKPLAQLVDVFKSAAYGFGTTESATASW